MPLHYGRGAGARRLLGAGLAAVAALAGPGASAQEAIACDRATEPSLVEAVAEARRVLLAHWLEVGQNLYIAYRMGSPPANPFDLSQRKVQKSEGGTKDAEEGYIWVGGLTCLVRSEPDGDVVVAFTAGAVSFIEKRGTWTPPLRQRLLTEMVVRQENRRVATERRGDTTLLTVEDNLRRPSAEEIPAGNRRIGIPCSDRQAWNGKRCTAIKRETSRRG